MHFIVIDGSFGEGGGQIIRTAVGLSGATGQPIEVHNIRAGRPKPGLSYQHLSAIKAVKELTNARVEGLEIGSGRLSIFPGEVKPGSYSIDIGTAGSVSLVLQTFLIPAIQSKEEVEVEISGGTDVPFSPPIDYIKKVFLRILAKMGVNAELELIRRGHYPKGGGKVRLKVNPSTLTGICIDKRGEFKGISGISHCTSLPGHIADRQRDAAYQSIRERFSRDAMVTAEVSSALGEGTAIVLWAEFEQTVIGASALGKRGKKAEKVGGEAAAKLLAELKTPATVDAHLGDQLIPYVALSAGRSSYICRQTSHTKTNLYTTEKILGKKFKIKQLPGDFVKIDFQNH
jgi:RNA 3'-phosphate cyclase